MAPFEDYFDGMGLGEYQAAMAYKQKKYGGGNGGGNGSSWQNYGQPDPVVVPSLLGGPLGQVDVGPQQAFQTQTFVPTGSGIPPGAEDYTDIIGTTGWEQYFSPAQVAEINRKRFRPLTPSGTIGSLTNPPAAIPGLPSAGFQVTGTDPATAGMAGPGYAPVKAGPLQGPEGTSYVPGLYEVPIAGQMDPVTTAQRATIEHPYYSARALEIMMNEDENRHLGIYDVGSKYWPEYIGGKVRKIAAFYTARSAQQPASWVVKNISNETNPLINYNWQQAFPGYSYEDWGSRDFDPALRYHPAQIQMGGITYPLARSDQALIMEQLGQTLPEDPVAAEERQNYLQNLYGPTGTGKERYGVQAGRYPEQVMRHEYGHALDPTLDAPYADALAPIREKAFDDHFAAVEEHANRKRAIELGLTVSPPTTMSPGLEADTPFNTLMANFPGYGTGYRGVAGEPWGGDAEFFAESLPLAGRLGLDAIPPSLQRFYSPFVTNEYDPVVRNLVYVNPSSEPQPVMGWVDPQRQFAGDASNQWHSQYEEGIIPEYRGNPDLAQAQWMAQLDEPMKRYVK